jgi:hypothetical protein
VASPKVAFVNTMIVTIFVDPRSTPENVADLVRLGTGVIQGASATTATGVLANNAAGGAWGSSTLPGTLFLNKGIRPN